MQSLYTIIFDNDKFDDADNSGLSAQKYHVTWRYPFNINGFKVCFQYVIMLRH